MPSQPVTDCAGLATSPGGSGRTALTGLLYGGGTKVLIAQCIGSFTICAATFAVPMVAFIALNAVGLLLHHTPLGI